MEGIQHPIPRTVEEVFSDFRGRRAGLIKALSTDVQKFYHQCDPEKENLCLYGLPNETWEVNLPVEEVPPELPEPALGINFARDGMQEKDWISLVAVHSDSWLISVAFYFGARFGFGKNERKRLFQMINDLPTIFEVVTGNAKQSKDQSANHNSSRTITYIVTSTLRRVLREGTMTEENATPLQPPQTQEDDEEEKAMYAIWAVPEDDVEDRLQRLMEGLRSEFGGPAFDPHLTLVGPFPYKLTASEAKRMFKSACEGFKVYPATVDQVSAGTSYFQCLYVSLRHTVEVMNAAGHFMAHFKPFTGKFYVPHMSILYGDLTEREKKKALEKAYTLDSSLDGLNFKINRVALWITDADVGSWVKVDEHTLIS